MRKLAKIVASTAFLTAFCWIGMALGKEGKGPDEKESKATNHADSPDEGHQERVKPLAGEAYHETKESQEDKHRRSERRYWRATIILSGILTAGAGTSAYYAFQAVQESRNEQIGWLAPEDFRIITLNMPADGSMPLIAAAITYDNIGHLPSFRTFGAIDLTEVDTFPDHVLQGATTVAHVGQAGSEECSALSPHGLTNPNRTALWPGIKGPYFYNFDFPLPRTAAIDLTEGFGFIKVKGCFVYMSGGKQHRSWFCRALVARSDQDPTKWISGDCLTEEDGAD